MHEVQKKLESAETFKDKVLVDLVIDSWLVVVEENDSQRALVTEEQFKSWETMKESTTKSLRKAIKSYNKSGLNEAGRKVFENLAASIRRADHKTDVELGAVKEVAPPKMNLSLNPEDVDVYEEQRNKWTGALAI